MGMDIVAIMEHNLSVDEVFDYPNQVNQWEDVFEMYKKNTSNPHEKANAVWDDRNPSVTKELILNEWKQYEDKSLPQISCKIVANNLDLKFNKKTVIVCPSPHHKYGNLYNFDTRQYVIEYLRLIGQKFNTPKIIYCVDSACSTAILEEKSYYGYSLLEIEKFGLQQFGKIPSTLTEAVYNYFFIDDFQLSHEDYPNDKFLFNRCNEEYFLEKKFGKHYIIYNR